MLQFIRKLFTHRYGAAATPYTGPIYLDTAGRTTGAQGVFLITPDVSVTLLTLAAVTGAAQDWPGGQGLWSVWGTWGGATAQLQYSPDSGTTWIDIDGVLLADNGGFILALPSDKLRVNIATPGGSTSLSSKMRRTG